MAFGVSLALDPRQRIASIEHANLLRQLGRFREALACFANGVSYEETAFRLPKGGRDARQVSFPYLSDAIAAASST
jgi:hypothetical protein